MDTPLKTAFYAIEEAIKTYRKFAQQNISTLGDPITLDQALILMIINEGEELSQKEIAEILFKDNASMTRMIELMVKNGYLKRSPDPKDRRRFRLNLTDKGKKTLKQLIPIVEDNRKTALQGVSQKEIRSLVAVLHKITANCRNEE